MRITAIALGLVLGGTVPLVAQEATPGPPHEGIKVHGHWTVDVREPDGKLVSHREFENALASAGATPLAQLLTHSFSVIAWAVYLEALSPDPDPCNLLGGNPAPCQINEPSHPGTGPEVSKNLQVVLGVDPVFHHPNGTVTMTGSTIAARSTSLRRVMSAVFGATTCCGTQLNSFTSRELATPVPVTAGQIIQVTILFSFS